MVLEDMHCVDLDVAPRHTEEIFSNPGKEYYVGTPNQLCVINQQLQFIQQSRNPGWFGTVCHA